MKEFVEYLIKNLVDEPEAVQVNVVEGEKGTVIEVNVAPQDIGKIVGRQGRTVKALRTITMTIGTRVGRKVRLEVIQPE
ncbi:MAG: KH domain-containing protein [Candidatus Rhabdochlamydia sp.]